MDYRLRFGQLEQRAAAFHCTTCGTGWTFVSGLANGAAAVATGTDAGPSGQVALAPLLSSEDMNALSMSTGTGKMVVELFSVAISARVCR